MKPPAALEPTPTEPPVNLDASASSKNRWWVWLLVFALIGFGCYKLYQYENGKKQALSATAKGMMKPASIYISAAAARRGDMPVYLQGLGTVTAFNTVTVKTRVDGQLISVNFKEGQNVRKGEVLAQIDPRPYQVALDQAKGNWDQAKGTLAKDRAALQDAQINYVRDQQLYKDQIIAKQQLDTQLATADQVRGSIEADQAAIAAAQAAIDNAKLNLTYTKITAPISGRIGLRLVDEGNMIHATDANGLAVITQLQPIAVLFSIPEDQLPPVLTKLRQNATMRAEAYDRDARNKLAEGTLLTVDNEIDTTTGTSRLKAVFPNSDYALFPNQFVNIRLWLDTKRNAIIVPAVAIQRGPTGTFVYLVKDDDTVAVRPVKTGLAVGNDISIDEGVAPGDRVVVDGAEKLIDGMKVTVRPAPARAKNTRSQQE
ncbi:MAG TPA: MdtA/MuxA family multidrug efflux RND transporter periplasmic adaptor subunit [Bryobacteraceae bacterium]|jgi:multidrug efflux system membrane fusion protein|nr:MdtA/MuxA family multidrug efflux RND transporter periplasmic adaptor subunit [Bryobacteraceae bacterium]